MKARTAAQPPVAAAPAAPPSSQAKLTAALRGAAEQHLREGRFGAAIPLLRQVLEESPSDPTASYALGAALARSGIPVEGLPHLQRAVARSRRDPAMRTELGHALFRLDRYRDALSEADEAIALGDDSIHPRMLRVIALERLREFDRAREAVDQALQLAPDHADAVIVQARLRRRTSDPAPSIEPLRWIASDTESEEIRFRALHELGMVLDRVGRHDEAFEAFVASGRARMLTGEFRQFPLHAFPAMIAAYSEAAAQLRSMPAIDAAVLRRSTPAPAFLVGFPRSGTTLTEQVLAAHPRIASLEERPAIAMTRHSVLGDTKDCARLPARLAQLTMDEIAALRKRYWEVAGSHGVAPQSDRVVMDKLPLNIVELPLIARVFPDARIIVALRDPRDVCLSCFMQDFRLNEAMVHFLDWERTASLYAAVMSLWQRTRAVIANPWMETRYEDLVANFDVTARRLLEFLELPWDDRMKRFDSQAAQREIRTPSFQAVAGGITSGAVGRWQAYSRQLERILPTLGTMPEAMGYGGASETESSG